MDKKIIEKLGRKFSQILEIVNNIKPDAYDGFLDGYLSSRSVYRKSDISETRIRNKLYNYACNTMCEKLGVGVDGTLFYIDGTMTFTTGKETAKLELTATQRILFTGAVNKKTEDILSYVDSMVADCLFERAARYITGIDVSCLVDCCFKPGWLIAMTQEYILSEFISMYAGDLALPKIWMVNENDESYTALFSTKFSSGYGMYITKGSYEYDDNLEIIQYLPISKEWKEKFDNIIADRLEEVEGISHGALGFQVRIRGVFDEVISDMIKNMENTVASAELTKQGIDRTLCDKATELVAQRMEKIIPFSYNYMTTNGVLPDVSFDFDYATTANIAPPAQLVVRYCNERFDIPETQATKICEIMSEIIRKSQYLAKIPDIITNMVEGIPNYIGMMMENGYDFEQDCIETLATVMTKSLRNKEKLYHVSDNNGVISFETKSGSISKIRLNGKFSGSYSYALTYEQSKDFCMMAYAAYQKMMK